MGSPVILVENFFSTVMFPGHTVTANEEATGHPVEHLANARRYGANYWASTTANADAWAKVQCDRVRGADLILVDRASNQLGEAIKLQGSQDNFTTYEDILDLTIPVGSEPGSIDNGLGVVTEEGVWWKRFPQRDYLYWRFYSVAMGAGLVPHISGLWLGKSYSPAYFERPYEEDADDLHGEETETRSGALGRGHMTPRHEGSREFKLSSFVEYDVVRYHLQMLYGNGAPMWIAFDDEQAERGFCVVRPKGRLGFGLLPGDWGYRRGVLNYVEYEPIKDAP